MGYTYDNAGRRASLTVPGQTVVNYTFDNANRLTQITQGTTTVSSGYDNANRRTTLTLPNSVVTGYSYDGASQLAGLTYSLGQTALGNLTYAYDNAGQRNSAGGSFARTGLPNAMTQTAYNANNQPTTWGTASLFYDMNGNMTSDGTHSYTWDARNRLTQMDLGNAASFSYDAFGRRTSKTILSTQTGFLYDGTNAVQELSGTTPTANLFSGGIDEVFQRTDSAGARSFLTDALGSTLALTDSSGTLQSQYTFEPFGNTTSTGSASTNSFAYTGRELDATGLYFYRARYYNPGLQRFIGEDPIGFGGGVNFYQYVLNNPIDFNDPFGLKPGDKYHSIKCAGWNAVTDINSVSKHWDEEFAGYLYKNADGTYSYTEPITSLNRDTVTNMHLLHIPNGTTRAGSYHTHAAYDPAMDLNVPGQPYQRNLDGNENFSDPDKDFMDPIGPGYLGTPKGTVREYIPNPGHLRGGSDHVLTGRQCACG